MARNFMTPLEWLTSKGFHLASGLHRPDAMYPLPLLPVWAVPVFGCFLLAGVCLVALGSCFRRFGFVALALAALYAEGVDSASAFALNKIYFVVFLLLAVAPTAADGAKHVTVGVLRAFQIVLVTLYLATGITKIKSGDWLDHSDVLWTHAQSYYTTNLAAFFLRHLPFGAWTVLQYRC
jgi:hypothetical protein